MLLLNSIRKPHMKCLRSPVAPSHSTLNDLEKLKSRSPRFQGLVSRKRSLGHMSPLHITSNRKAYMGSPLAEPF